MAVDPRAVAVARRAVDIAAARGIALADLALWDLAGGRPAPSPAPAPGEPDDLGALLEASLHDDDRRHLGAHYTPPWVADEVVALAMGRQGTVCDPACGAGAFLLAAARALEAAGARRDEIVAERLWGSDLDPVAVAAAEAALALWSGGTTPGAHLAVGDGLLELPAAWGTAAPRFDLVVGNPPFLSQLASPTARPRATNELLRERYGAAMRAYTDAAWLFLVAACDLAAPGGRVALLQPLSVLGARDAAGVREAVSRRARLVDLWLPEAQVFDAAVNVCAPVLALGTAETAPKAWTALLASRQGVPDVALQSRGRVGDVAQPSAGFRDEYYGLAPAVREARDGAGAPLVTAGVIDLGRCAWGERPVRFAKRSWQAPVVDLAALVADDAEGPAARWAARNQVPKVVVATQTRVVEAAVDEAGTWVASVPLVAAPAPPERLWLLAAALCAPPITAWVVRASAGTARSPRALKLSARLVADVPLPADRDAWTEGADALRRYASGADAALDDYATSMCAAYGLVGDAADQVQGWWRERL